MTSCTLPYTVFMVFGQGQWLADSDIIQEQGKLQMWQRNPKLSKKYEGDFEQGNDYSFLNTKL